MHFMQVGAWQGLKPAMHAKRLRGAEAPLFHGEALLMKVLTAREERDDNWSHNCIFHILAQVLRV
jgi:hypothetical protein